MRLSQELGCRQFFSFFLIVLTIMSVCGMMGGFFRQFAGFVKVCNSLVVLSQYSVCKFEKRLCGQSQWLAINS